MGASKQTGPVEYQIKTDSRGRRFALRYWPHAGWVRHNLAEAEVHIATGIGSLFVQPDWAR